MGSRKIFAALLAIALVAAVAAVLLLARQPTGFAPITEMQAIEVGAILPLSGKNAYIGQDMREGMELAVEKINAGGGVNGVPLKVVFEDSAGDQKLALSAFKKLRRSMTQISL